MHRKLLFSAAVACLLTSSLARAAVMSRDWKTAGDGLLTYDDVNQREWLDVPETLLLNFGNFGNVISQTKPGGLFEGFSSAKSDDVTALALSAGIDAETFDFDRNQAPTRALVDLLGVTVGNSSLIGFLDEFDPLLPNPATPRLAASFGVNQQQQLAGLFFLSDFNFDAPGVVQFAGVMLYRPVPEPPSIAILSLGMAYLLVRAFSRRKNTHCAI